MNRSLRRLAACLCLSLAAASPGLARSGQAADPARAGSVDGVYVVGALHGAHASEDAFDFETLRRLIDAVDPDVLIMEVRPEELASRSDTPGRPEYPAVVWPWLSRHPAQTFAMEPDAVDFSRITSAVGARITAFQAEDPRAAAFWRRLRDSVETALRAHWTRPADTQDQVTADLARSLAISETQMIGPAFAAGQAEWEAIMQARAQAAVLASPGRRVLVLGSYRNRVGLEAAIRAAAAGRVVDIEPWLRSHELGPGPVRSSNR